MVKRVQMVGHVAAEADLFTGRARELTFDTTNMQLRGHDGATQGGHRFLNRAANDERYILADNNVFTWDTARIEFNSAEANLDFILNSRDVPEALFMNGETGEISLKATLKIDNIEELTEDASVTVDGVNMAALRAEIDALQAYRLSRVGIVEDYAGETVPDGWLPCDGAAVSRTTYATLFAAIGTKHGPGDGISTFNVPDSRGKTSIGAGTGTGLTARTLGETGGEEAHELTATENAQHSHEAGTLNAAADGGHLHEAGTLSAALNGAHNHTQTRYDIEAAAGGVGNNSGTNARYVNVLTSTNGAHTHDVQGNTAEAADHTHDVAGNTANSGSGDPHNNMQPFIVFNKIIYAGV